ncbi:hypothetical protein PV755_46415 [Streptomyces caniscabiei]|uniref:hypothetical protein n=1 Tax=Streptomyces caniscabiei TaxID=2746961 RepID=UPI0029BEE3C1|nr:hypothetical protein [Streptomyces caniscabiei]MDX3516239.1 hypothetical protein [Streptomyces caniscabiei]
MTQRIPLDHLTSDQYDALCDELDRAREAAHWIRRNYPALTHVHDRLATALDQPKDPAP